MAENGRRKAAGVQCTVAAVAAEHRRPDEPRFRGRRTGRHRTTFLAEFSGPRGRRQPVDSDSGNDLIRRLSPAGILTTVAGTHRTGWVKRFASDNGPALKAKLNETTALALGPDGAVYIADTENHRIRRVAMNGVITTVAGTGSTRAVAVSAAVLLRIG